MLALSAVCLWVAQEGLSLTHAGDCAGDSQHMPCHSWTGVRWWTNREAHAEGRARIPQVQGEEELMAQGTGTPPIPCCFRSLSLQKDKLLCYPVNVWSRYSPSFGDTNALRCTLLVV